ncbi:MAG: universal stress protein [Actinobacteria bacterium]|nr:MAG: universal stress protein [Actinomycetota bacterium]
MAILLPPPDANVAQDELMWHLERHLRGLRDGSAFVLVPTGSHAAHVGPIVCAVDASSDARRAMRLAGALGAEVDAPLVLAHAVSLAEVDDVGTRALDARARLTTRHRVVANVRRVIGERQFELLRGGRSTQCLLTRFAHDQDARLLIVFGPSWLSGDVSRAARCPVVVMSPPVGGGPHMPS